MRRQCVLPMGRDPRPNLILFKHRNVTALSSEVKVCYHDLRPKFIKDRKSCERYEENEEQCPEAGRTYEAHHVCKRSC